MSVIFTICQIHPNEGVNKNDKLYYVIGSLVSIIKDCNKTIYHFTINKY